MSYELSGEIIIKSIENKDAADENNLTIKDFGGLYIIKYNKEKINGSNITTLGLYRSFIADKNGNIIDKNVFVEAKDIQRLNMNSKIILSNLS